MSSPDVTIIDLMVLYAQRKKMTDEQMRILEEFWKRSPEHQKLAEQFGDAEWVKAELAKLKPAPVDQMWEEINSYLDEIGAPDDRDTPREWEESEAPSRHRIRRWVRPVAYAASAIFCAWGVWILYTKYMAGTTKTPSTVAVSTASRSIVPTDNGVVLIGSDGKPVELAATVWNAPAPQDGNPAWQSVSVREHSAPFCVRLQDGSSVWLDGGSRLQNTAAHGVVASSSFAVEGKAFFDVVHDPSRRFCVATPHGRSIEVLGTSFTVEAKKEDSNSRVSLLTGKVRLRNGADSAILRSAHEAVMGPGRMDVRPLRDSTAVMAWVKKSLYFHFSNTEFAAALAEVASCYGYTVDNPKGLQGTTITDVLRKDQSPEEVVYHIGGIENGFLYVWVTDKVIHVSDSPPPHV